MKNKLKTAAVMFAFLALLVITTGVTMAFFTYNATGETLNTITVGGITFHYKEMQGKGHGISIKDALPVSDNGNAKTSDDYFEFKITSTTTGGVEIPYVVTARMNPNSDSIMGDIVDMYLTEVNGGSETPTELFSGTLPKYNELEQYDQVTGYTEKIIYTDTVTSRDYEKVFRLRMWIDQNTELNTGDGTSDYNDKEFSVTVNVNAVGRATNNGGGNNDTSLTYLNAMIMEDNEVVTTEPTLNKSTADSNESGFYKLNTISGFGGATGAGSTYYFRGNMANNVVEFGTWKDALYVGYNTYHTDKRQYASLSECQSAATFNRDCEKAHDIGDPMLWRVVRINEDETTRLVLDDKIDTNYMAYNSAANEYTNMYYTNSALKANVESWRDRVFNQDELNRLALGKYYCEAAKVCGSVNYAGSTPLTEVTAGNTIMPLERYYTPNLECTTDGNGKGIVETNIGLLTYDEMRFAGAYSNFSNSTYYLYKGVGHDNSYNSWMMSPGGWDDMTTSSRAWYLHQNGGAETTRPTGSFTIRPVINLKADTTATRSNGYYVVD